MTRQYVPNGNDAAQYLKEIKHDQFGTNAIADDGNIDDGQLITLYKQTFLRSGHHVSGIIDINIKRAKSDSEHRSSQASTYRNTRVTRFGVLYNKE